MKIGSIAKFSSSDWNTFHRCGENVRSGGGLPRSTRRKHRLQGPLSCCLCIPACRGMHTYSRPVGTSTKSPPSNTCVLVRINEAEGRGMPCIKMEKVYKMTRLQDALMGNRKACIWNCIYT